MRRVRALLVALLTLGALITGALPASATPVCTDGYMGGPPLASCGGRIFPEAELARTYVQYGADPSGFREYQHGLEYLAQQYPRWVSVSTLSAEFGPEAVSAGEDDARSYEEGDTGDGREILVIKLTDHEIPDEGKETLFFSLSVHGNERGGLEGGLRTAEDLAVAAEEGGTIVDGIDNYDSTTGAEPEFHTYEVADVLASEAVYLVDFNPDGWAVGDTYHVPSLPYQRGNGMGTDLNRQMPTIGRINSNRNPLQESEMRHGLELMERVAREGRDGLMAYAADVHGELTSNAYIDIMYPAGQFDSVDHRRLMAIAERTKSVVDATLYEGIIDEVEAATGGNEAEQPGPIPTKPAHWATVWDTLGYTDTGFIGDYMATDLGVTGMDYEIFLNHTVPDRAWNVYLQENHINGTRVIIKTAMAYALTQSEEFSADNVAVETIGRAGYVVNPDTVTDADADGVGTLPGPEQDGIGADGEPVAQRSYEVTNMRWFADTSELMPTPFVPLTSAEVASDPALLDLVDTLVLADVAVPDDPEGADVDAAAYWEAIGAWVERGGNLVLTDRAVHGLAELGLVGAEAVADQLVYQPYADVADFEHPLVEGLRPNARQLVEAAVLGYCIGRDCSPMTTVAEDAFTGAGGEVVATTGDGLVSLGQLAVGDGQVRIVGGALPTPSEAYDHRFGLRDYALTYSGLYVMENAIRYDVPGLGEGPLPAPMQPEEPPASEGPGSPEEPEEPGTPEEPEQPGEPEVPGPEGPTVRRVSGLTRVDTAIELSEDAFSRAGAAVLARADDFPDALVSAPLASELGGPVLLTARDRLDEKVVAELERLEVERVVLAGGEEALSDEVATAVERMGIRVERVAGADRFATAAEIARAIVDEGGAVDQAIVALGATGEPGRDAWPDALAAGSLATVGRAPIVLTTPDDVPEATLGVLGEVLAEEETLWVAGGRAAVEDTALEELRGAGYAPQRLAGASRYDTAVALVDEAVRQGADETVLHLASGANFPDALAAAPAAAARGGVTLLVAARDLDGSPATRDWVGDRAEILTDVVVAGGREAVAEGVLDGLRGLVE